MQKSLYRSKGRLKSTGILCLIAWKAKTDNALSIPPARLMFTNGLQRKCRPHQQEAV